MPGNGAYGPRDLCYMCPQEGYQFRPSGVVLSLSWPRYMPIRLHFWVLPQWDICMPSMHNRSHGCWMHLWILPRHPQPMHQQLEFLLRTVQSILPHRCKVDQRITQHRRHNLLQCILGMRGWVLFNQQCVQGWLNSLPNLQPGLDIVPRWYLPTILQSGVHHGRRVPPMCEFHSPKQLGCNQGIGLWVTR